MAGTGETSARGMKKKAFFLALVLVGCAACGPTSQQVGGTFHSDTPADAVDAGIWRLNATSVGSVRPSFAALPDRGDLVAYPSPTPARRDGAYTWHRAELSEAHAFQSLQSGSLRITSPSGRPLDYEYVRHVEHPSGDWTWVGRLRGGAPSDEAVVTFGERAAFGSIAEPGRPDLRLVTREGAAWLVETDPSKVAQIDNSATRPRRPDFLIPPELATVTAKAAADMPLSAAAAPAMAGDVSTSATTVVDVVVGYTTGFASGLGGTSQALTRINNLVEITNQAYANSQIDARVRLVHALAVSYPDATSNKSTLEELTGYRSGVGSISVPAAFQPLRNARQTYGGDLVALVRDFQTPENDGCGMAWLIGGNRSGIDATDERFGYSVVSDGTDGDTDGKTYFCREETLVHELGHNMGSQHDIAAATDAGNISYGVYSYSFGYKTGPTAGNFYTVMAYGDSGQVTYRVFSNPSLTTFCGERPCGLANQADNARSLRQTIPIIAQFRAERTPTRVAASRHDLDGNGVSDIFWRNSASGTSVIWYSANPNTRLAQSAIGSAWQVVGDGDLDGDGSVDVLWRNLSTGANIVWRSGLYSRRAGLSALSTEGWQVAGLGDFDGDRRSDVLWRNSASGQNMYWPQGDSARSVSLLAVSRDWAVAGIGDLSGDGRADVLWRNAASGSNIVWYSARSDTRAALAGLASPWAVAGIADFDGDSRADILWRNISSGENRVWPRGLSGSSRALAAVGSDWFVASVGDYAGDNSDDIIWRNKSSGVNVIWNDADFSRRIGLSPVSTAWSIRP